MAADGFAGEQEISIDSCGRRAVLQARRRSVENAGSVMLTADGGGSAQT